MVLHKATPFTLRDFVIEVAVLETDWALLFCGNLGPTRFAAEMSFVTGQFANVTADQLAASGHTETRYVQMGGILNF